jgi:hypothetical protein
MSFLNVTVGNCKQMPVCIKVNSKLSYTSYANLSDYFKLTILFILASLSSCTQFFGNFLTVLNKNISIWLLSGSTKKQLKFFVPLFACLLRIKVHFKDLIMQQQTKVISA